MRYFRVMLNRSWPAAVFVRDWGNKVITILFFKGWPLQFPPMGKMEKKKKTRFQNPLILCCQRKFSLNNNSINKGPFCVPVKYHSELYLYIYVQEG